MKKISLLLIMWVCVLCTIAQPVEALPVVGHSYSGSFGFNVTDEVYLDEEGNSYLAGWYSGTVNFGDTTYTSWGWSEDVFIQKRDPDYNILWTKAIGSWSWDVAGGLTVDKEGNVLITGIFQAPLDFDPGKDTFELSTNSALGYGEEEVYLLKLNKDGEFIWAKSIGGNDYDEGWAIATDDHSNVYVGGSHAGKLYVSPGSNLIFNGSKNTDGFLLKFDSAGTLLWANQISGKGQNDISQIVLDEDGNVYVGGYMSDTLYYQIGGGATQTLIPHSNVDVCFLEYSSDGDLLYAGSIGGTGSDFLRGMAVSDSNLYLSIQNASTLLNVDLFNDTSFISTDGAAFLATYDRTTKEYKQGFSLTGWLGEIHMGTNSNLYVSGSFGGFTGNSIDVDPSAAVFNLTTTSVEPFFAVYNESGDLQYAKTIRATGIQTLREFSVNPATNTILMGGNFTSSDFWIDTFQFVGVNGTSTSTAFSVLFYDCEAKVHLSLDSSLLSTEVIGVDSYQWVDCDNNNIKMFGENDPSFDVEALTGNYAVITERFGCEIQSECYEVESTNGVIDEEDYVENQILLYPNPVQRDFNVQLSDHTTIAGIRIYGSSGELINVSTNTSQGQNAWQISLNTSLASGMYFLQVEAKDHQILTTSFVVR